MIKQKTPATTPVPEDYGSKGTGLEEGKTAPEEGRGGRDG